MSALNRWWVTLSVLTVGYFASTIFIPLVVAIFSAMLLWPLVSWSNPRSVQRTLVSVAVALAFIAVIGCIGWFALASVSNVASALPDYSRRISDLASQFQAVATAFERSSSAVFPGMSSLSPSAQKVQIISALPEWTGLALRGASSFMAFAAVALVVPLLVIYFFIDKENMIESVNTVVGKFAYLPKLHAELPRMVRSFALGNFLAGLVLVFFQALTLYALGYANWASLGLISGICNLIPIVGTPLAILFPLCQALLQFQTPLPFIVMIAAFFGLHFLANNLIVPHFVGSKANVNAPTLILGLLFWSWYWGVAGFFIAIPMTALVKIFLESHPATLSVANLLAAKPNLVTMSRRRRPHPR